MQWRLDAYFELAVRKPTKLISLPLMRLVVGLEERGSFVRWTPFSRLIMYSSTVVVIERVTVVTWSNTPHNVSPRITRGRNLSSAGKHGNDTPVHPASRYTVAHSCPRRDFGRA